MDIRQLDGASAMNLACRVLEMAPVAPDGSRLGSVAVRAREQQKREEIERTNYHPDRDNEVMDEADIQKLLADGELDDDDVDWS